MCVLAGSTSLYITLWALHDRTVFVTEIALMPRVDDVPEFSVHFHVHIVEVVAEWWVVILVIVIIVVVSNRRCGRNLSEASVGVRAVVAHPCVSRVFARGLLLPGCVLIFLPVIFGQPRFGWLSSVGMLATTRFPWLKCGQLWIEV